MSTTEVLQDVIPTNDPPVQSNENEVTANDELPAVKYMREISYWSPTKYPRPKRKKKTNKKNRKCKKLDKPPQKKSKKVIPANTNMTLFTEEPPVVDENGEHSEVQILKIHPDVQVIKEFNPDELLANLS